MRAVVLLAVLLLGTPPAVAARSRLAIEVEPASATIGDPVTARLVLAVDGVEPAARPTFPEWGERWGDAEILAAGPVERRRGDGGLEWTQELRLAAFRVGPIELPPVVAEIGNERARSEPARFEVRSVLPENDAQPAPRPPAPPRGLEVPPSFWALAAALALAAGAAAWALHRRRALAPPAASLSPLAELERALGSLAGFEPEHGHVALSLAFRRYLGRALTLPATASTTSELARAIDRRGFEPTLVRRAVRLLRETDQIKFARRSASADELGRRAGEARELAVALDRQLHPPAEESAA